MTSADPVQPHTDRPWLASDWLIWLDRERQAAEKRVGPDGDVTADDRYDHALLLNSIASDARSKLASTEREARRMNEEATRAR